MAENNELEIDFLRILKALLKKAWLILLAAVILGGGVFAYNKATYVPRYDASTTLFVHYASNPEYLAGHDGSTMSYSNIDDARELVHTSIALLETNYILNQVIDQSGLDMTVQELSGMVHAKSVDDTELFTVTVKGTNAEQVRLLANTIGQVLPEQMEQFNSECQLKVVDEATDVRVKNSNEAEKNGLKFGLLGAIVMCAVITLLEIVAQFQETRKPKEIH